MKITRKKIRVLITMSQTDDLPITGSEDTGVGQKLLNLLYSIFIIIIILLILLLQLLQVAVVE